VCEYAVLFRDYYMLISSDDKHCIKIGEPGFPVAAAECGKRVIVSMEKEFSIGDHDFTKFSLIPSASFIIDIPDTIDGSWYDGEVHISLNCFISKNWKQVSFVHLGVDHRLTFVSVQLALITLSLSLNLDFICAGRTCPYHSWRNPVEHIMSIINLGLLMRDEG